MLYMTPPVVLYPLADGIGRDDRFDFYLTNAETAYGYPPSGVQGLFGTVRDGAVDIETYGAAALRMLLAGRDRVPWITFDCRSAPAIAGPAPSYRLAAKAGLRTTSPVMLAGQGGIEAMQAMRFFASSARPGTGAIVSSAWETDGDVGAPALTGLFASACLLDRLPIRGAQIRIHGIGLARGGRDAGARIVEGAVGDALRQCGSTALSWIAASPGWEALEPWSHCLQRVTILGAKGAHPSGSNHPDPLLALARYGAAIPEGEPGLLVCIGRTGTIGALILSTHDREAKL